MHIKPPFPRTCTPLSDVRLRIGTESCRSHLKIPLVRPRNQDVKPPRIEARHGDRRRSFDPVIYAESASRTPCAFLPHSATSLNNGLRNPGNRPDNQSTSWHPFDSQLSERDCWIATMPVAQRGRQHGAGAPGKNYSILLHRQAQEIGKFLPIIVDAAAEIVLNIPCGGNPHRNSWFWTSSGKSAVARALGIRRPERTAEVASGALPPLWTLHPKGLAQPRCPGAQQRFRPGESTRNRQQREPRRNGRAPGGAANGGPVRLRLVAGH